MHVHASKSWSQPLNLCDAFIPVPFTFLAHTPAPLFRLRLEIIQYTSSVDAFWDRR